MGHLIYCSSLNNITIPNSVTSIGEGAFQRCRELKDVTIGNDVIFIGNNAFESCTSLTNVTIKRTEAPLTRLSYNVFDNTPIISGINDAEIVFPVGTNYYHQSNWASLRSIWKDNEGNTPTFGDWRYAEVSGGIEVSLYTGTITNPIEIPATIDGKKVVSIGISIFEEKKNEVITIDMSKVINLKTIGHQSFLGCSNLTSITIPDGVTSIGKESFRGCSSLTNITIPDGVTSIGDGAFNNCSSLTSITIPNSVTSIGDYAFDGCSSLTSITIPNSVTSIGDYGIL